MVWGGRDEQPRAIFVHRGAEPSSFIQQSVDRHIRELGAKRRFVCYPFLVHPPPQRRDTGSLGSADQFESSPIQNSSPFWTKPMPALSVPGGLPRGEHEPTIRPEDSMAFLQHRVDVWPWRKRVHADNGIDSIIGKVGIREVRAPELDSTVQAPLRNPSQGDVDRGLIQIHADASRLALSGQPERDSATATSKVGEPRAGRQVHFSKQPLQQFAGAATERLNLNGVPFAPRANPQRSEDRLAVTRGATQGPSLWLLVRRRLQGQIWKMLPEHVCGCMRPQRVHNDREWIRPDFRKIRFAGESNGKCQALDGRRELRIDASAIASGVQSIPPDTG